MDMRTVAAVTVISTALLLAGCGGDESTDRDEAELGAVPVVAAPDQISLPFDAYRLTTDEDRLNGQAYVLLVQDCALGYGVPVDMVPPNNPPTNNHKRYGLFDERAAATEGYGGTFEEGPAEDRSASVERTPDQRLVIAGPMEGEPGPKTLSSGQEVPEGGCAAAAEKTLGTPESGLPDVEAMGWQTFQDATNDSRVAEVMEAWSDCMADAGFEYDSIWDANDVHWPDPPTTDEIATAQADVTCKQETNLVGVYVAVEAAYQREVIEAYPGEFDALAKWRDARLKNISAALSSADG